MSSPSQRTYVDAGLVASEGGVPVPVYMRGYSRVAAAVRDAACELEPLHIAYAVPSQDVQAATTQRDVLVLQEPPQLKRVTSPRAVAFQRLPTSSSLPTPPPPPPPPAASGFQHCLQALSATHFSATAIDGTNLTWAFGGAATPNALCTQDFARAGPYERTVGIVTESCGAAVEKAVLTLRWIDTWAPRLWLGGPPAVHIEAGADVEQDLEPRDLCRVAGHDTAGRASVLQVASPDGGFKAVSQPLSSHVLGKHDFEFVANDTSGLRSRELSCAVRVVDTKPPTLQLPATPTAARRDAQPRDPGHKALPTTATPLTTTTAATTTATKTETTTAPVLVLRSEEGQAASLSMQNAHAQDSFDGLWSVAPEPRQVSLTSTGTHLVRYHAQDSSGNAVGDAMHHAVRVVVRESAAAMRARVHPRVIRQHPLAVNVTTSMFGSEHQSSSPPSLSSSSLPADKQAQRPRLPGSYVRVQAAAGSDVRQAVDRVLFPSRGKTALLALDVRVRGGAVAAEEALLRALHGKQAACGTLFVLRVDVSALEAELTCRRKSGDLVRAKQSDLPETNVTQYVTVVPHPLDSSAASGNDASTGIFSAWLLSVVLAGAASLLLLLLVVASVALCILRRAHARKERIIERLKKQQQKQQQKQQDSSEMWYSNAAFQSGVNLDHAVGESSSESHASGCEAEGMEIMQAMEVALELAC